MSSVVGFLFARIIMIITTALPEQSELGKKSAYVTHYDPTLLFPIARKLKRDEIGVPNELPFYGFDIWNHYEVSWLNQQGKPIVALATIVYSCTTPNIIESKSMKLYFNSFNQSVFSDVKEVQAVITGDISANVGGEVTVTIHTLPLQASIVTAAAFNGLCIDTLDVTCQDYLVNPDFLTTDDCIVNEVLYSDLLKSNCLVTEQPDWGSVQIAYRGKQINASGLLKYIVSFRHHNEFHEQCIERIYMDIWQRCQPLELTVYGRYTRRGGLDINPFRSSTNFALDQINNIRLCRQ